jgi:hypothetical protein
MIAELTQHLCTQIETVSALAGSTGTTLGGTEADPTMTSIPMPAAWVIFESAQDTSQTDGKTGHDSRYQKLLLSYRVVLVLRYGEGETDLKAQLKMIEDVAAAVRGKQALDFGADPWSYDGCSLLTVETNRIAYALSFQTMAYYK